MPTEIIVHLFAASYVLLIGTLQLLRPKGTTWHRRIGYTWMCAMVIASLSSFWIESFMPVVLGLSPIHLLSIWVLICVVASVYNARARNIRRHRNFAVGAYIGTIGAGVAAIAFPNRVLYQLIVS